MSMPRLGFGSGSETNSSPIPRSADRAIALALNSRLPYSLILWPGHLAAHALSIRAIDASSVLRAYTNPASIATGASPPPSGNR